MRRAKGSSEAVIEESWVLHKQYDIPNCLCGQPIVDQAGRVLMVRTCPACQQIRLDIVRGVEYAIAHVKRGDTVSHVLVKQKEFFST